MKKQYIFWLAGALAFVLILVAGILVWNWSRTSTTKDLPPFYVEMADGETVSSWSFKGAYTGNTDLETKAQTEIEKSKARLGSESPSDYLLYVDIANQYNLLGDGAKELEYLEKALAVDSTATGLAWNNVGALFMNFGAYRTARMAYERAVATQPIAQYHAALLNLLEKHFLDDASAIRKERAILGGTTSTAIE